MDNAALLNTHRDALLAAARAAHAAAYAPYSHFSVGAAVLLSDGTIYKGCNVENASYGLTCCAERVAVFSAVADGRADMAAVAVFTDVPTLTKPCGACRQVLAEFSKADNPLLVLCANAAGDTSTQPITDLLPDTFSLL